MNYGMQEDWRKQPEWIIVTDLVFLLLRKHVFYTLREGLRVSDIKKQHGTAQQEEHRCSQYGNYSYATTCYSSD